MNIAHMLKQKIYRAAYTGVDVNGQPQFSAAIQIAARVEYTPELVLSGRSGIEKESTSSVWTLVQINEQDRIWFPGDSPSDINKAKRPISVEGIPDIYGVTSFWRSRF